MTIDFNPVPVMYTDEELASCVYTILADNERGDTISFNRICTQIVQMAKSSGKVKPDTEYNSSEISLRDQLRLSAIMWDMIFEKKVFPLFGSKRWFGCNEEDTLFVIQSRFNKSFNNG